VVNFRSASTTCGLERSVMPDLGLIHNQYQEA
jgi:hypothetical protein